MKKGKWLFFLLLLSFTFLLGMKAGPYYSISEQWFNVQQNTLLNSSLQGIHRWNPVNWLIEAGQSLLTVLVKFAAAAAGWVIWSRSERESMGEAIGAILFLVFVVILLPNTIGFVLILASWYMARKKQKMRQRSTRQRTDKELNKVYNKINQLDLLNQWNQKAFKEEK